MRSHRSFVLSLVVAASVTLLAVACGGNYSESTQAGPSAIGGTALSTGGTTVGGGTISLAGSAPKVDVCHSTGNGSFQLVNDNALLAHLNHGDAQPGQLVPGDPTKEFDDACGQVDVGPPGGALCPCAASFAGAVDQWVLDVGPLVGILDDQNPESSMQCTQEIDDPLDPDLGSHIDVGVGFFPPLMMRTMLASSSSQFLAKRSQKFLYP